MIDRLETVIVWLFDNKEWLFSGIGLKALALVPRIYGYFGNEPRVSERQITKNNVVPKHSVNSARNFFNCKSSADMGAFYQSIKNKILYFYHSNKDTLYLIDEDEKVKYARMMFDGDIFFADRFSRAFPGCRTIVEINDPYEACRRLDLLLASPISLDIKQNTGSYHLCPIWWFRGGENLHITSYKRLRRFGIIPATDVILDEIVLHRIRRITAISGRGYWANIVYVETEGVQPSGLYQIDIERNLKEWGFVREEVGIFRHKFISREQFDDGASFVRGRPVSTAGKASLQVRYLTPYNFILAPNESPINDSSLDHKIEMLLNEILTGDKKCDDLAQFIEKLRRRPTVHRSFWHDFKSPIGDQEIPRL